MKTLFSRLLGFLALAVLLFQAGAGSVDANGAVLDSVAGDKRDWQIWKSITGDSYVPHLAFDGSAVWAGTGGGVVRWNVQDGSYTKYNWENAHRHLTGAAIAIDAAGNKWFANCDGLVKFDGIRWTEFPDPSPWEVCFQSLAIDPQGNVWGGAWGYVYKFDGANWTYYDTSNSSHGGSIRAVAVDKAGNIWVGNNEGGGVFRYDGVDWTQYASHSALPSGNVYSIFVAENGDVWVGAQYGVSKFDGTHWYVNPDEWMYKSVDYVNSITEGPDNELWFGTSDGVYKQVGTTLTQYSTADGLSSRYVRSAVSDNLGRIWFGTDAGISRYDGSGWTVFNTSVAINNIVTDIEFGANGVKWFATNAGISKFDGTNWTHIAILGEIREVSVKDIALDSTGNLWVVMLNGSGVLRYDGNDWTLYDYGNGWPDHNVFALGVEADSEGNVWVGTHFNGLLRYDGSAWEYKNNPLMSFPGDCSGVTALGMDHDNNIWYGTAGNTSSCGVTKYDGSTWTTFDTADGLAGNYVNAIASAPDGSMWFATASGVSRFDGSAWTSYGVADGLAGAYATAIYVDQDGRVWVAVSESEYNWRGVSMWENGVWTSFTPADGLLHNAVYAIQGDENGELWFGTFTGISKLIYTPWRAFLPAVLKK